MNAFAVSQYLGSSTLNGFAFSRYWGRGTLNGCAFSRYWGSERARSLSGTILTQRRRSRCVRRLDKQGCNWLDAPCALCLGPLPRFRSRVTFLCLIPIDTPSPAPLFYLFLLYSTQKYSISAMSYVLSSVWEPLKSPENFPQLFCCFTITSCQKPMTK